MKPPLALLFAFQARHYAPSSHAAHYEYLHGLNVLSPKSS